ncbi:MAG: hypothetical protein SVZ03_01650 [Spirochaetota bacterium]|nr:hypothetical protein [Spirochaetota bacterium]
MIKIFILFLVIFMNSCSTKCEFDSLEKLVSAVVEHINKGEKNELLSILITSDEYVESIHPYTKEGKEKNALPARDFWDIFIGFRRKHIALDVIKKYQSRIIELKSIGKSDTITDTGEFKILKKIPVTLTIANYDGTTRDVVDDKIFGAVVERNNKYELLNIFR